MGSIVPLGPRTELALRTRHSAPAISRQLDLALDNVRLQGMTPAEHRIAIRSLARLLLEADGITAREDGDDNA
jgi:hypothetical protein